MNTTKLPQDTEAPDVGVPVDRMVRPRAWMRRWYFDGETPHKERNEKGRIAWPVKFKWLPVTPNKIMEDDVPLYANSPAA